MVETGYAQFTRKVGFATLKPPYSKARKNGNPFEQLGVSLRSSPLIVKQEKTEIRLSSWGFPRGRAP